MPDSSKELVSLNDDSVVGAVFGDAIQLESIRMMGDSLRPGDIVQIELTWRALEPLKQRYKVFLHLVDENGVIVAQRDSEPGGGLALTTTWTPEVSVEDNHGVLIPYGTAPGEYQLLVGLYDSFDPSTRLLIQTAGGVVDALPLAKVLVGG